MVGSIQRRWWTACLLVCMFAAWGDMPFVRRDGMHFMAGDQRFYYLGASCYYLAYWAADTSTNSATGRTFREEADAYLVRCRNLGFNVVRIWAFNDGADARALQPAPGVHREEALVGYDYVFSRGAELGLRFVMTLVNNWDDYGGMRWYATNSSPSAVHSDFYTDPKCRAWYEQHVSTMISRTNSFNGRVYRDDPSIFSWQLANEPRWHSWPKDADAADESGLTIRGWVWDMAAYVKGLDTNHMVSTGEEGWTVDQAWEGIRWELNNTSSNIDYTVIHCWPDWWIWLWGEEPVLYSNAMAWVEDHLAMSEQLGKPMVLSEYGKNRPLDGEEGRHSYYQGWFDIMHASALSNGPAAGLHFWMLEAEGSTHDDGFSVFPTETGTLTLLSSHAQSMNTLIAPQITAVEVSGGSTVLAWPEVVGQPSYEIHTSTNLQEWAVAGTTVSNAWNSPATNAHGFYRIRPFWP